MLKVYNKQGKLNITVNDANGTKTVTVYKYEGKNMDAHTFSCEKNPSKWASYYDLNKSYDGETKETVSISNMFIEQVEYVSKTSMIKTVINLESGNIYKKKIIYMEGEKYEAEFKNGELFDIPVKIKKSEIKKYINKTENGKQED